MTKEQLKAAAWRAVMPSDDRLKNPKQAVLEVFEETFEIVYEAISKMYGEPARCEITIHEICVAQRAEL